MDTIHYKSTTQPKWGHCLIHLITSTPEKSEPKTIEMEENLWSQKAYSNPKLRSSLFLDSVKVEQERVQISPWPSWCLCSNKNTLLSPSSLLPSPTSMAPGSIPPFRSLSLSRIYYVVSLHF